MVFNYESCFDAQDAMNINRLSDFDNAISAREGARHLMRGLIGRDN